MTVSVGGKDPVSAERSSGKSGFFSGGVEGDKTSRRRGHNTGLGGIFLDMGSSENGDVEVNYFASRNGNSSWGKAISSLPLPYESSTRFRATFTPTLLSVLGHEVTR